MIKVLFICHGNICRSTMAESVFTHMVHMRHMASEFVIDSAATSTEELGNPPHYGTVAKLRAVGIPVVPHRARRMLLADYDRFDYLIGMDSANIRNMTRIAEGDPERKIRLLLDFAADERRHGQSIADPWYTGDFDETYRDICEGLEGFFEYLKAENRL